MASLFQRQRSAFWWLKFRDAHGKWHRKSTRLRIDVPVQTRKARALLEAKQRVERNRSTDAVERWERWVPAYISQRYEDSPLSLRCNRHRWIALSAFLRKKRICWPAELTFAHCLEYVSWRRAGDKPLGIRPAARGTAADEIKFLGTLMTHAVRLGYASANPCLRLGVGRQRPKEKPEFSDEQIALVLRELQKEPPWMLTNFLICLYTGCRATEASLPLSCVDVDAAVLHFPKTKGSGDGKPFTVPIRPELVELFRRLKAEGRSVTFEIPPHASLTWWHFFHRVLPTHCLHSTRVSYISRGLRSGIPEHVMVRLVNHASTSINRIYQRYSVLDVRSHLEKIQLPSATPPSAPVAPSAPATSSLEISTPQSR